MKISKQISAPSVQTLFARSLHLISYLSYSYYLYFYTMRWGLQSA